MPGSLDLSSSSSPEAEGLLASQPRESSDEPADEASTRHSYRSRASTTEMKGTLLGAVRAYWLGTVVCMAGFLFGYDSGIIGGVLTFKSFDNDYNIAPTTQKTPLKSGQTSANRAQSLSVSLQCLGAFVACFFIWPINRRIGRKPSLILSSLVFCVGVIIQTVSTHSLAAFYVARVIAGIGLGAATVVVPMYSSEMTPRELRGQIGCFFQLFYTLGIFTSYWVDYGVSKNLKPNARQWQIPVGLQLLPAGLLGLGMFTLPESLRWYVAKGDYDKAWKSLCWVRASSGPEVEAEWDELKAGIALELRAMQGLTLGELLTGKPLKLMVGAFLVFMAQQATGATAFAYYSTQYFKAMVGGSGQQSLLLSGIFGAVKVVACGFFVFVLSERVGRRKPLIFGAMGMAITMIIAAAVVKTHPPPNQNHPQVTSSGIATVAMIYLFVIVYNMSWGALPWPYVSEIFPTRLREPGVGVGVASQWLWAFVFTEATPYMISSMKYGTFLFWGFANVIIAAGAYFLVKETGSKSLEEINAEVLGKRGELERDVQGTESGSGSGSDVGREGVVAGKV
ncbi:MAG: hypothetical protein Q9162_001284 [Coniocarpon cinnabarinum]